jgi:hypothetical protein
MVNARQSGQLYSGVDVELREDVAKMTAHRVLGDKQLLSNLSVGQSFCNQSRHRELGFR